MIYNTQLQDLPLPEYGRNIQNMVNHCVSIPDKEERTKCANTIINIMGDMFPHLRDVNDFKHILWDHLAIMADFKLDIDYPYEVVKKEDLFAKPEKLPYSKQTMSYRHYGAIMEQLIAKASEMNQDEDKTKSLVRLIAMQMKRSYLQFNKEVDDAKIFADLLELSQGKINITTDDYTIPKLELADLTSQTGKGKKKKKK